MKHLSKFAVIIISVVILMINGCSDDPFFIPVSSITDVPESGIVGISLKLMGNVKPSIASNTAIDWSIIDSGATGASLEGSILSAENEGNVVINAVVANGLGTGKDYNQKFNIIIGIGDQSGENGNKQDFTGNVNDFTDWLEKQPDNTENNPYKITLNIDDAEDFKTLKATLNSNKNKSKYVYLDLSGSTITEIPDNAFGEADSSKRTTLTGITIPDSVTSIGEHAFQNCTNLVSVTIPDSVTSIGIQAFCDCNSLTSVIIGNNVKTIGDQAFYYCTNLASVTIGSNVETIGVSSFAYCASLTGVTFSGAILSDNFGINAFPGDLVNKYTSPNGGIGTYTTTAPVNDTSTWSKKP